MSSGDAMSLRVPQRAGSGPSQRRGQLKILPSRRTLPLWMQRLGPGKAFPGDEDESSCGRSVSAISVLIAAGYAKPTSTM